LDAARMNEQAQDFVGTHDFSAFCSAGSKVVDTVRTIRACAVRRTGELVEIAVEGDGFLYNMVRIMVGTLLELERGRLASGSIPEILASRERERAGLTAPACGLWLDEVFYDR
ncbi:MAG: tRNA pseudouridine(38-40) synthase TruA, partial [Oscillospiraceae bacterium]